MVGQVAQGRTAALLLSAVLGGLFCGLASADAPNAVLQPEQYRESITGESLRAAGFDPTEYKLEIPLSSRLSVQREYVSAGDRGLLSPGFTERGTDTIRLQLNKRGTVSLTQDEARGEDPFSLFASYSRKRSANVTQGFGGGPTAGTLALLHEESYASDTGAGFSRSQTDTATLTLGLGRSLGLTAGASASSGLAQVATGSRKFDVALARPGTPALAEYHQTETEVGGLASAVNQLILRTPTVDLGDVATVAATHQRTESSASGLEAVSTVNVTANPTDAIAITASHVDTDRSSGPDTAVTSVGSQIRLTEDTSVSASYGDTETEGVGAAVTRSVEVARTPADGTGLGVRAAYTDLSAPGAEIDPTVDVQLAYKVGDQWAIHGRYHDENNRPSPEVAGGVQAPVLGGALNLTYSEYVYDAAASAVRLARNYGAEMSRPLIWGLSGQVGYQFTDSLSDPTEAERIKLGLGGENRLLGKVSVSYETGAIHTPAGRTTDATTIGVSLARPVGVAEISIAAQRRLPAAPPGVDPTPNDQIRIDLKAAW